MEPVPQLLEQQPPPVFRRKPRKIGCCERTLDILCPSILFSFVVWEFVTATRYALVSTFVQFSGFMLYVVCLYLMSTVLTLVSFFRAAFTEPGTVDTKSLVSLTPVTCVFCGSPKPARTHHCSVCGKCRPRMDHHCVFVGTCVAKRNYKFFLLLLVWGAVACFCHTVLMWQPAFDSILRFMRDATLAQLSHFNQFLDDNPILLMMFPLTRPAELFASPPEPVTISAFLGVVNVCASVSLSFLVCLALMCFSTFHMYLTLTNQTTLQSSRISYSVGWFGNIKDALGPTPLLWLVPVLDVPPAAPHLKAG
eukprot:gnl/Spiro4/854_TR466_c0_g1_i1.p1 gnl/Spiro4/854_TR466_c0_g1~~gnl/Spiro4/854_TR466_c0_g1_i1.p1  ORF type:complete len:318 (+),score=41.50 gnl/Spiro4/854_TR466_c0_g1_i1:32-955(+)